jgi:hypothetical protein
MTIKIYIQRRMIPLVINYVWIADKRNLGDLEVLVLEQAARVSDCRVILHTNIPVDISGVEVRLRDFPTEINGHPVKHIEHRADIARLEIALEEGGFFSDTDIYLFEPISLLCPWSNLFAYQNKAYKTICIGFFGCSKGNQLIKTALNKYKSLYPPKNYWGLASFKVLIDDILEDVEYSENGVGVNVEKSLAILPQKAFFPIRMKDTAFFNDPEEAPRNFKGAIGCHLWGHVMSPSSLTIVMDKLKKYDANTS